MTPFLAGADFTFLVQRPPLASLSSVLCVGIGCYDRPRATGCQIGMAWLALRRSVLVPNLINKVQAAGGGIIGSASRRHPQQSFAKLNGRHRHHVVCGLPILRWHTLRDDFFYRVPAHHGSLLLGLEPDQKQQTLRVWALRESLCKQQEAGRGRAIFQQAENMRAQFGMFADQATNLPRQVPTVS